MPEIPGSELHIGRYYSIRLLTDGTLELVDTLRNVTLSLTPQETCLLWDYLLHHIAFIEQQAHKG